MAVWAVYTEWRNVGMELDIVEGSGVTANAHARELRSMGCERVRVVEYASEADAYADWERMDGMYNG